MQEPGTKLHQFSKAATTVRSNGLRKKLKKYESELQQGFFDKSAEIRKSILKESRSSAQFQPQTPNHDVEEDKENHFKQANVIEDQEEVKLNPKKSHKKPTQNSKKVVKEMEQYNFMPKLSKNSLMIASSLGDPLERLTSKKKTNRRTKNSSGEDHSFTPKINTKSTLIDSFRRDRSMNRFQELHEQVLSA